MSSLPRPLVLAKVQVDGQSVLGWSDSALTGSREGGELSSAGDMRTLSSSSSLHHCFVDNTAMFSGDVVL